METSTPAPTPSSSQQSPSQQAGPSQAPSMSTHEAKKLRISELTKLRNRIKGTNPLEVLSNVAKIAPALKKEAEAQIKGAEGRRDRKSTRLNSSHSQQSRMPSSA